jgi:broad specificity phosphatase PhoE
MSADAFRLFAFARHAESEANAAHVLSSDPARPVALTAGGRTQARALGAQLANLPIDLAVGTRLLRTQQTIDIALTGRPVPVMIEPGFDELRAGDLDGAPIDSYWSWRHQHTPNDRLPHGESLDDALQRFAGALRRLLARNETVTLIIVHELALRYITAAATNGAPPQPGAAFPNAVLYLFDQRAAQRAAASLDALALSEQPQTGRSDKAGRTENDRG